MDLARTQKLAGILVESKSELKPKEIEKLNGHLVDLRKLVEALPESIDASWDFKKIDKLVDQVLGVQGKVHDITMITGT